MRPGVARARSGNTLRHRDRRETGRQQEWGWWGGLRRDLERSEAGLGQWARNWFRFGGFFDSAESVDLIGSGGDCRLIDRWSCIEECPVMGQIAIEFYRGIEQRAKPVIAIEEEH